METKIFIVLTESDLNVFYTMPQITEEQIKRFVKKVTNLDVTDIYEERQSNLQYYCNDGRVWIDTPEKVKRMLEKIN